MTTQLPKERLTQIIRAIECESYDEEEIISWVNSDEILSLVRYRLAAYEQEPVGEVFLGEHDDCGDYPDAKVLCIAAQNQADWNNFKNGTNLYTHPAPSIPAAVPDFDTIALGVAKDIMCDVNRRHEFLGGDIQLLSRIQCRIDDAIRAAMLNQPSSNQSSTAADLGGELKQQASNACWCHTCRPVTMGYMRFVVCPDCGNKRCPKANDHRNACSGSNEPGQEGSAYPAAPKV